MKALVPLKSWRGPRAVLAATSGLAIAAATLTVAPAANAAVSGFVNGPVGVTQTITVTDIQPGGGAVGEQFCTMVPTINGVAQSSVNGPITQTGSSSQATFQWTPLTTGAATFTLSNCDGLGNPGAVTISPVATTTTISAPNTAKVGTATKITVTVQSNSPSSYQPTDLGEEFCTMVPTINGVAQSSVNGPITPTGSSSQATFQWTPLTTGAATFTLSKIGRAHV